MNGLIAISGFGAGPRSVGGCGCGGPRPMGQTPPSEPSRTPAYVALGVLALAIGVAFMTEPRR